MRAFVRFRTHTGSLHELVHGDLIGRLHTAALPLDDGRVSEAHAMVSLREGQLRLIALRGMFALNGEPCTEIALEEGQRLLLARGLEIEVDDVVLPAWVLGLEGPGFARQTLPSVASLVADPSLRLVQGIVEGAAARFWSFGEGWRWQRGAEAPEPFCAGDQVLVQGLRLRGVEIPLAAAGQVATRRQGGVQAPMKVVCQFETVHLQRDNEPPAVISGILARIVSELASFGGPVHWSVLAGQLWPRESDAEVVRSRLDVNLSRLRRRLRELQIRTDLVRTDGAGQVELLLYPHDTVEDKS